MFKLSPRLKSLESPTGSSRARSLGPRGRFRVGASTGAIRLRPWMCVPARTARSHGPSHPDAPGVVPETVALSSSRATRSVLRTTSPARTPPRAATVGYSADWGLPFASGTREHEGPAFLPGGLWARSVRRGRRPPATTGKRRHLSGRESRTYRFGTDRPPGHRTVGRFHPAGVIPRP